MTGLTITLTDKDGTVLERCDWQDAAQRFVEIIADPPYDVRNYATAHRVLAGMLNQETS